MNIAVENLENGSDLWLAKRSTNDGWIMEYTSDASSNVTVKYNLAKESGMEYDFLSAHSMPEEYTLFFSPSAKHFNIHLNFLYPSENGGRFRITSRLHLAGLSFDNVQEIDTSAGAAGSFATVTPFRLLSLLPRLFTYLFASLIPTLIMNSKPVRYTHAIPIERSGRMPGLDIIRCLAVIAVIATHSMTGTSYYSLPFEGSFMFILTFLRSFFICCVPFFMILSGFLLRKRSFGVAHYVKILNILLPYITCCVIVRVWQAVFLGYPFSIRELINTIFFHELAWYMEMYIGFYLFVPLLNLIWDGIAQQNQSVYRHFLLVVLLISISSLCTVTDNYITNYWESLYPIAYYFIGCFLGTYKVELCRKFQLLLIALLSALYTLFMWHFMDGDVFNWTSFGGYSHGYNALPTMLLAAVLFLFFQNMKFPQKRPFGLITRISNLSLEFYLISSSIVDPLLLSRFNFKSLFRSYSGFGYFLWLIPYLTLNMCICFVFCSVVNLLVRFENVILHKIRSVI